MDANRRRTSVLITRAVMVSALALVAWLVPFSTLGALAIMFGGFTLIDGGFALVHVFTAKEPQRWVTLLWLEALVSIVAGGVTLLVPGLGATALTVIFAGWVVVIGALEVYARRRVDGLTTA